MEHTDQELLGKYRQSGDKEALQDLIRRHLDMVYSAALRLVRDRHLADDVTQAVFIVFAQKAASLPAATIPAGWLYRTTRFAALNAMKSKHRRERYEQLASRPERVEDSSSLEWQELAPHVDQALAQMRTSYRDAILLRFFRGMSLASVGQSLGVSEEAARKLVDRGVSQLRAQLATANLSCTDAGLVAALTAGAVTSAPAHLAQLVLTTAAGAGAGASAASLSPLIKGTITMLTWTKTNIAIAAVTAALLIGGGATTIAYTAGAFSSPQKPQATPVAAAQASPAPAGPTHLAQTPDIASTPADPVTTAAVRKTMAAVMAAAVSAEAGQMGSLSYANEKEPNAVADAGIEAILVGKKLRDAVTKKFGPITQELEGSLPGGPAVFRQQYIPNAPVTMRGDLAIVPIDAASVPKAMAFRKVNGEWRMDLAATFSPTPEAARVYMARLKRITAVYDELVQQIASGECESQGQAAAMIRQAAESVK